jgi:SAM-dependent methyltransferase
MKLNVGAGTVRLDGFENVDVRAVGPDVRLGHAGDLSFASDGMVDVLFAHAVFEHVYPAQQLVVLREWKRVLAPGGVAVCIGIPDFEAVASAYVAGAPGATAPTFDLFEVYRYTHGHPEHQTQVEWPQWDPAEHADATPPGYSPQLHKGLFDTRHLSCLLERVGFEASLLRYAYPGEIPEINLGFAAGAGCADPAVAERHLLAIPEIERFVRRETLTFHPLRSGGGERFVDEVARLDGTDATNSAGSVGDVRRAAIRLLRGIRATFR